MGKRYNALHFTSGELIVLQISHNKLSSIQNVEAELKNVSTLETVYLEGNPLQAKEGVHYRRKVILALPQLKQLDAT